MAHFIYDSDNNLVHIAANDSDKDNLNVDITASNATVKDVSEDQFNKIRLGQGFATLNNNNVELILWVENSLKEYLNNVIQSLQDFVNENPSHPQASSMKTYEDTLRGFNTSSLTYPLEKSWETYCNENSITFYHPLQIP